MSTIESLTSKHAAALVAKFSLALASAAMEGIERATIDQGRAATLDEDSLRWAIYAGIAAHLTDEIENRRNRATSIGPSEPLGGQR